MSITRRTMLGGTAALLALPAAARAAPAPLVVRSRMAPPRWAQLQRQLLAANTAACEAFYASYVNANDALKVFVRWGANDGPDDAAEATNDWATLHALGAPDRLLDLTRRFWEGHLRQYSAARTTDVPIARAGMYHREFPVQMDWQHNAEGLTSFNVLGMSAPGDRKLVERTARYADFYTGRDPSAPNYDPQARVIRSLFNGSRGPMLRQSNPIDWAGDPFDPSSFHMEHGEGSYAETLQHYAEYDHVVGDNPLNLQATTLGLNAYALGSGDRFRQWALDYLGAWAERARANGDLLPSYVPLDGTVGRDWWRGVYGWGFSPAVPRTGVREHRNRVPRSITAFFNALLLSGDMEFLTLWRRQNARINAQARTIDGVTQTPTMFGAEGWYGWKPGPYRTNGFEIWYATQDPQDLRAAGEHPWIDFLHGRDDAYPERALQADLDRVAERVAAREADRTTAETRLADWPIDINPASAAALVQTMTGGLHIARPPWSKTSPPQGGVPLHCRLRYFDADRRRAGVPEDVAALVHSLGDRSTEVTLVNLGRRARTVIVQGGSYGEHRIDTATVDGTPHSVGGRHVRVRIEPGCGARLSLAMTRYANRPTLAFPWA
jgi:hypothetical protein